MALLFGKAVTNCFLGLIIQAIKILGLKFLEVLWDGVYEQEETQVGLVRLLISGILIHLPCAGLL